MILGDMYMLAMVMSLKYFVCILRSCISVLMTCISFFICCSAFFSQGMCPFDTHNSKLLCMP